ncbi:hypothetical protein MTY66_01730 [Mycolicibacterium sp. TY66]|nr:hypothetical protein MTY66_01730 [Mycolicibacterium sp. TY66]BCJ83789.1 hypothetical protein MTY81_51620 [Mycolicibacterium sp. TY81]
MTPPAACLTALIRAIGQDCAATRRAPPILTLNIVFGALNVRVRFCSNNTARATRNADGARPAAAPTVPTAEPIRDGLCFGARLRDGRSHGTRTSCSDGSSDSVRIAIRRAETPSSSAWWAFE